MIWLRTLLFTVLVPATVTVYLPWWIVSRTSPMGPERWRWLAAAPIALGAALYVWCAVDFALARGTPAPIDPPRELVARGPYRWSRNPMYLGVASVLLGEALWFGSRALLGLALVVVTGFHAFVTLYEEPSLRRRFGDAYESYCRAVPRWLPRRPLP